MKPLIFLSFANDNDDYLPMITRERKNIFKALQSHHDKGYVQVHNEANTTIGDIFDQFTRYNDRIVLFHYGGHAGGSNLLLETPQGGNQLANAAGLAQLMGQQKKLRLVFLNGCATQRQVEMLLDAGVKVVIATSIPVDDCMATEFAEQFYNALAQQATLQKAFYMAKAFLASKYGLTEPSDPYLLRTLHWKGKDGEPEEMFPWGLYSIEDTPEVMEWKLPSTNPDTVPIPTLVHAASDTVPVNTLLIETLFREVARYRDEVGHLAEAWKRSNRLDIRKIRQTIIDCFPVPVGEQLRRLFAGNQTDVPRLKQLVATYETIIKLLAFTMLSQLWEARFKNPRLNFPDQHRVRFNDFFDLDAKTSSTFNYVKLMESIAGIFKQHNIPLFIEEIRTLGKSLLEKDELYTAHLYMEEMRQQLAGNRINAEDIKEFCIKSEEYLCTIMKRMAFFVRYKLTSIKRIEIIKRRYKQARFRHNGVILDNLTAGLLDQPELYDSFTENNSVVLLKDLGDVKNYLSLSPFVIDENALTGNLNSKLYFYSHRSNSDSQYYYQFIDNTAEKMAVDEKYPLVKEQFEEFKESISHRRADQ